MRCSRSPPSTRSEILAISSRPNTPTTWSTSGNCSSSTSFCRSARQPATTTPPTSPARFRLEHLPDDAARLLPGRVDEPAGIDDDQVGAFPFGDDHVPVLRQEPEHPLGIDQVLRAPQADEADGTLRRRVLTHHTSRFRRRPEPGPCSATPPRRHVCRRKPNSPLSPARVSAPAHIPSPPVVSGNEQSLKDSAPSTEPSSRQADTLIMHGPAGPLVSAASADIDLADPALALLRHLASAAGSLY